MGLYLLMTFIHHFWAALTRKSYERGEI